MTLHDRYQVTTVGKRKFAPSTLPTGRYSYPVQKAEFRKSPEEIITLKELKKSAPKTFSFSKRVCF